MITTVIFDLDDTLYDELDYCMSGFRAAAGFLCQVSQKADHQRIFRSFRKQFAAGNRTGTFNAALDELGVSYDKNLIEQMVRIYRNHIPQITLPEESRETLEILAKRYSLAMLTDGFLPAQKLKVDALGIEKYFKCIVYTEQMGREFWKPSPAGFEKLLRMLKAEPAQSVYIADNEKKDFIAPNNLGMTSIRIIRPLAIHKDQPAATNKNAAADYVIHRLSKLPVLLEKC